jgi:DNA-binding transcriptional ArsR family regulator
MRRDVFQAIADPTRREIINLVAHQSLNLNSVAENFNVSRPAISKHIKILTECGLIVINQQGRERFCEARLEKLNEVSDWVERYKAFWESKLDALEEYLVQLQASKNQPGEIQSDNLQKVKGSKSKKTKSKEAKSKEANPKELKSKKSKPKVKKYGSGKQNRKSNR